MRGHLRQGNQGWPLGGDSGCDPKKPVTERWWKGILEGGGHSEHTSSEVGKELGCLGDQKEVGEWRGGVWGRVRDRLLDQGVVLGTGCWSESWLPAVGLEQ